MSARAAFLLLLTTLAGQALAEPRVVRELDYGEALFHFYQEDYFQSAARLLAAQEQGRIREHGDDAELLLGGIYLSYGQQREANDIFERLLDESVRTEVRDRAWLYAAQIAYQRGSQENARRALTRISGKLEPEFEARRRLLDAQILMDEERYVEAVDALSDWRAPDGWRAYAQYNLGVAMIRQGQADHGTRLLNRAAGRATGDRREASWLTPWRFFASDRAAAEGDYAEDQALRDKIYLALGFAHLKDGAPAQAQPVLMRVGAQGPWANKARLGAGWAAVEVEDYRSALDQWRELDGGDPLDPAVQESRLGVPFALAKLGDADGALTGYRDAIETFGGEIERLERMSERLRAGDFLSALLAADTGRQVGWFWSLDAVPDSERGRYLYRLMADHEFQEGLKNYRDLTALGANLERWEQGVEAFDVMLATREKRFAAQRQQLADGDATARLAGLEERHTIFAERLAAIDAERDTLGLATAEEAQAWERLARIEATLARVADTPKYADARDKQRLLRGVVLWRLNDEYAARLWEQRKALKQNAHALAEARDRSVAIGVRQKSEPKRFADFGARIAAARPRIAALKTRVETSLVAHENYLKDIAIDQFEGHQQRLQAYLTEAQYALASTYDRLSRVESAP